ncbi:MAG: YdjY domain-containing protein, partial [Pirellulaceae bacterium]|nr:YdjY domain-containing protein [Pirellulaceae bacterium]
MIKERFGTALAVGMIIGSTVTARPGETDTIAVNPSSLPRSDRAAGPTTKPGQTLGPNLRIDLAHRFVDIDAKVVFKAPSGSPRQIGFDAPAADWLELVASTPGMREHESIVTVRARPSHIHQALLLIGLVPGAPMCTRLVNGDYEAVAPHGAHVAVSALVQKGNKSIEVPINQWVIYQKTKELLPENIWLFTGSIFRKVDDRQLYMADLNGSVISLVNFGDDLLARPTMSTNQNDAQAWAANREAIPPVGTSVVIRLRALPPRTCALRTRTTRT